MESRAEQLQNDLVEETLKAKRIENSKAKHEWWKSTLKFIGGGLIVILSGFVNNYSKTYELETTKIHSVVGNTKNAGLLYQRPFRSPHHTISNQKY